MREDAMSRVDSFKKTLVLVTLFAFVAVSGALFAEEDEHYIQPDDYFISKEPYKTQAWMYVQLAKMKTPATAETKSEAEFMQVGDGSELWTKNYWQTRMATQADLKLGAVVIMLDAQGDGGVYRAPENKDEARTSSWFMAKITDLSDMYKGHLTVSGGYKVDPKALRVLVGK
jgi:hypothetical protein